MTCSMGALLLAKQRLDNSARRVWRAQQMVARMLKNGEPADEAEEHLETLRASLQRNRTAYAETFRQLKSGLATLCSPNLPLLIEQPAPPTGAVLRLPVHRSRGHLRLVAGRERAR
jgi:DNA-binding transcriptional MocR family regulator